MTRGAAVGAVALLLAMSLVPMLADTSESAVSGEYNVYIKKGCTWTTSYTYTSSLSPYASVLVSSTAITDASTGWSSTTTNTSAVTSGSTDTRYAAVSINNSSHKADLTIKVGTSNTISDFYVGVKLTTYNPTQVAITVFHVHMTDPSLTGYSGGSFYVGQTFTTQTPTLSAGGSQTASNITYSISAGSNSKTLDENTGLSFDASNGKISGTVGKATNSTVSYTVTASFTTGTGYHNTSTATTVVTIGTYSSASLAAESAYAIRSTGSVNIDAPTTSGITYSLQSATYTLDGGSTTNITVGTAFNGLKVNSDGSVSGTPTVSGVYSIKENFKVNETNQTGSRTVTVTVEDQVVVSVSSGTVNTYVSGSGSGTLNTANHTESKKVTGTWGVSDSRFSISSDGKITAKSALAAGTYDVTATYTSSASGTNTAGKTFKINVDSNLALSCSDTDKTLYAATSSKYISGDLESAEITQSASLYAGSKTLTYSLACSTLTVGTDVSIDSEGNITLAGSYDSSKVGSHTVKVTCTDDAVSSNKATMDITVTIVEAMVLGTPAVGTISSS